MSRMKFFQLATLLGISNSGLSANYPDVQQELCGPAKTVHAYLEQAGFFEEVHLAVMAPNGLYLTYLPEPQRVRALEATKGQYFIGVEVVQVLHTDWTPENPENWRCITSIRYIGPKARASLAKYFNDVNVSGAVSGD